MRRSTNLPTPDALVDLPCACATVRRAARAVTQLYDGHLRASDIEGTQFALLSVLKSQAPCSQAAISERFALDKTTLSRANYATFEYVALTPLTPLRMLIAEPLSAPKH